MNESTLFLISFILYILSAFFYFAFLFSTKKKFAKQGYWAAAIGLAIHTVALVLRIFESGHAPFTNMYESLSFFGWSAVCAYVFVEAKFKLCKAGPYYMLIVILDYRGSISDKGCARNILDCSSGCRLVF